jgi:hypothetical protein
VGFGHFGPHRPSTAGRNQKADNVFSLNGNPEADMEHRTLEQFTKVARISRNPPHWMNRRRRLERFARLLEEHDGPMRLFSEMECFRGKKRLALHQADSPVAIAFHNAEFRREGLNGASVGDAVRFFDLSPREAHHMLCDCGYSGVATPKMVADRARAYAAKVGLGELCSRLLGAIK